MGRRKGRFGEGEGEGDVGWEDGDVERVVLKRERERVWSKLIWFGEEVEQCSVRGGGGGGRGERGTCLPITPMHAIEGDFDWGDGVGMCICFTFLFKFLKNVESRRGKEGLY